MSYETIEMDGTEMNESEMSKIVIRSAEIEPEWVDVGETPEGILKVRPWVPYKTKEEIALALAMMCLSEDEDNDIVLISHKLVLLKEFLFIANYTNIEIDLGHEVEIEELVRTACDWLMSTGLRDKARAIAEKDLEIVNEILWTAIDAYMDAYDGGHSLSGRIKKTFREILNGESLIETLSGSEEWIQRLGELLRAYSKDKEEKKIPIMGGRLDLNGLQVDIRKKAEK